MVAKTSPPPRTTFGKVGQLFAAKTGLGGQVLARTTFRMTVPQWTVITLNSLHRLPPVWQDDSKSAVNEGGISIAAG